MNLPGPLTIMMMQIQYGASVLRWADKFICFMCKNDCIFLVCMACDGSYQFLPGLVFFDWSWELGPKGKKETLSKTFWLILSQ